MGAAGDGFGPLGTVNGAAMRYDLLVLGSDDAAQTAALEAARQGRRVALLVPPQDGFDETGASLVSIPHVLRRFVAEQMPARIAADLTTTDLRDELRRVAREESEVLRQHLEWNGVEVFAGRVEFADERTVTLSTSCMAVQITAETVVVATGTRSHRPAHIPFDGERVFVVEDLLALPAIPESLVLVGGGRTGLLVAAALAFTGTQVVLLDEQNVAARLGRADRSLHRLALELGVEFRYGREVIGIDRAGDALTLWLADGSRLAANHVLWSTARVGQTDGLNLPAAGLEPDERGRLWCDTAHRTWAPHILGAGDVVTRSAAADESETDSTPEPRSPYTPQPVGLPRTAFSYNG